MRLLPRLLIGLLWLTWCALRTLNVTPVISPEGVVTLAGVLRDLQCDDEDRCRLRVDPALADAHPVPGPVTLLTDGDAAGVAAIGDVIAISAYLRAERLDTNPGVAAPWSPPRARWRAWQVPTATLGVWRAEAPWRLPARPLDQLASPARALYQALLLGDRRGLALSQRHHFADTGTAHLLAISGLHLAVLGWGLYRCILLLLSLTGPWAQTRRLPVYASALAVAGLWTYVLGIQPSAATQRAATFLSLIMIGGVLARRLSPSRALMTTAALLLTWDPTLALGASFQLSFAAVGALVASRPTFASIDVWLTEPGRLEGPLWTWTGRWLARALGASLVTTLATTPLTLAWFGQFSPWGVLVNLAAVPFASLLLVPVGFAWYLLAGLAPELAAVVAWLPEVLAASFLEGIAGCAELTGPSHAPAWPHLAGLLGASAAVALCAGRRWRVAAVLLGLLTALLLVEPEREGVVLTALDVGHGDALIVQGPEGRVALIDTGGGAGPEGDAYLASRTLLPALARLGHARLDALVLTHADLDHMGAAAALMERLEVSELWIPPCALSDPRVQALTRRLSATGGRLRVLRASDIRRWGSLTWEVLWPRPDLGCEGGSNESGLVLRLDYGGGRVLLTADVGHDTEDELLSDPAALRAELLKVGHHGSRGSTSVRFLDAVRPRSAIVSGRFVGGSMPPHNDVLGRLCGARVQLAVTGRDGAIQWTMYADRGGEGGGLRPP
jgi:competence protein ComEC